MLKNPFSARLLKKVQMQGGARCEARGVLSPYVAAHPLPPRRREAMSERANAPPLPPCRQRKKMPGLFQQPARS